jgi:hypothetical protein
MTKKPIPHVSYPGGSRNAASDAIRKQPQNARRDCIKKQSET